MRMGFNGRWWRLHRLFQIRHDVIDPCGKRGSLSGTQLISQSIDIGVPNALRQSCFLR